MASVTAIRRGIADQLDAISGLRIKPFAPDSVSVPAAAIELTSISFDTTFGRGFDELTYTVRLYASRASDRAGQEKLDGYLAGGGATSVKQAIESDRTLGGIAHTLRVTGVDNYGVYEVGQTPYYGAEFAVTVWARGV